MSTGDSQVTVEPAPRVLRWPATPTAQQEVLACMVDMFTQQEIAQMLGKTEAAVRQNLHAARKRLMRYLAETDDTEPAVTTPGRRSDERQQP